jgi:APA family basic amino acid/polyamine antiporter
MSDLPSHPEPAKPHGLLRVLGLGFGLAVTVGSILGIGILRSPGLVAAQVHSTGGILVVWLLGGLYTLVGAVCFVELGTALPEAGGYYVYARRAFGTLAGFAVGWIDWLTYCAVLGYASISIGEYSAALFHLPEGAPKPVAIGALALFGVIQWTGVRTSSRFQEVTTAAKFVAFLILVAACLVHPRFPPPGPLPSSSGALFGLVFALQAVTITYGGWQSALYFAEEDPNPAKNLPRSMIGGVVSVIVVYLLINLALLAIVPVGTIAGSKLPAADAAAVVFGAWGGEVITLLSLLSLLPLLNAILMIGTRILFAMGRDGLLFPGGAVVNARGTPARANFATIGVASALVVIFGDFQSLVGIASFFLALNYCVCCIALMVLRVREPQLPRPFRAWGYPYSAIVVLLGAGAFLYGTFVGDPRTAVLGTGLLLVGVAGRLVADRATARA